VLDEHTSEEERHFGIVGRLTGDGVPCAAVGEVAHAVRISTTDVVRRLELDEAAEGISGELREEAGLGALDNFRRDHRILPYSVPD
jgi:hypothetical protein